MIWESQFELSELVAALPEIYQSGGPPFVTFLERFERSPQQAFGFHPEALLAVIEYLPADSMRPAPLYCLDDSLLRDVSLRIRVDEIVVVCCVSQNNAAKLAGIVSEFMLSRTSRSPQHLRSPRSDRKLLPELDYAWDYLRDLCQRGTQLQDDEMLLCAVQYDPPKVDRYFL